MQYLLMLETEKDAITLCRLMNIFRRKGLKLMTMVVSSGEASYSITALAEVAEAAGAHLFHFLRRTEGVRHVTSYRQEASTEASFIFVDAAGSAVTLGRLLEVFPQSEVIFASEGKFLLAGSNSHHLPRALPELEASRCVPLVPAQTTRPTLHREGASAS